MSFRPQAVAFLSAGKHAWISCIYIKHSLKTLVSTKVRFSYFFFFFFGISFEFVIFLKAIHYLQILHLAKFSRKEHLIVYVQGVL